MRTFPKVSIFSQVSYAKKGFSLFTSDVYPNEWKKSNVVCILKKESKNLIENYRPISLLPVFSKVFERIIINSLLNYFLENKLFTECQSGFLRCDSCISQLLSITHEIYKSFDYNLSVEVRGTILDISKAFDKAWHDGFILLTQVI